MTYAELTDDELRLEVARRCGEVCYINDESDIHHIVPGNGVTAYIPVPDYPHDLTAAIALLDGMTYPPEPDGRVLHVEYVILKETYHHLDDIDPLDKPRFIVEISSRNPIYGDSHWATADTLPRAACVAWLMWDDARKEAQNDKG